ncbi:MAG: hypothetical protein ACFFG0_09490 [Candidatus Thorarchaeota archaeon]
MYTIDTVVRPDINKREIDFIRILPNSQTIEIGTNDGYDDSGSFQRVQTGETKVYTGSDYTRVINACNINLSLFETLLANE